MSAFQTHYTSSRKGRSGTAGFGFHIVSDGVDSEDLREIEQLGEFRVSRDLDPGATIDEIDRSFPILMRFRALTSGRWALIRSRYTGRDYSGRSGNYFAHGLIVDPVGLEIWPVDLFEWEGWQDRLDPEQDTGERAPPLPEVDLTLVRPAPSLQLAGLKAFLAGVPDGLALLEAMIRAALSRSETDRPILIRDDRRNGVYWAACLQKAFPQQLASFLSFCTYQFDSYDCEAINISVGDTNFRFNDRELGFRFHVFDQEEHWHSDVAQVGGEYAATVSAWMVREPRRLTEFHRFMEQFEFNALDANLLHGLRLFLLTEDRIEIPSGAELVDMLDFTLHRTRVDSRGAVLKMLSEGLGQSKRSLSSEEHRAIVELFTEAARLSGKPEQVDRAVDAWLRMFDDLVIEQGALSEETDRLRQALVAVLPGADRCLAQRFVSDAHLEPIGLKLRELDADKASVLLQEALHQLTILDDCEPWPSASCASFLCGVAGAAENPEPLFQILLQAAGEQAEPLAEGCRLMAIEVRDASTAPHAAGEQLRLLGRCLCERTAGAPADSTQRLRSLLDHPETHDVLRGEWLQYLEGADDAQSLYECYTREDLPRMPGFTKAYGNWLRSRYFERLDEEAALAQAQAWLRGDGLGNLEAAALGRAAQILNDALPVADVSEQDVDDAKRLCQVTMDRRISLSPDRALIIKTLEAARRSGKADWRRIGDILRDPLAGLTGKEYRALLVAHLPGALTDCRTFQDHGTVLSALTSPSKRTDFLNTYLFALSDKGGPLVDLKPALKYWLLQGFERWPQDFESKVGAFSVLADALARSRRAERKQLAKRMREDRDIRGPAEERWRELQDLAIRRRTTLSRLVRPLARLFNRALRKQG